MWRARVLNTELAGLWTPPPNRGCTPCGPIAIRVVPMARVASINFTLAGASVMALVARKGRVGNSSFFFALRLLRRRNLAQRDALWYNLLGISQGSALSLLSISLAC